MSQNESENRSKNCPADPKQHSRADLRQDLRQEVQFLPGVGPAQGALLAKLGIRTVLDLMFYFPRRFELPSEILHPNQFQRDLKGAFVGVVESLDERCTANGKHMLGAQVSAEDGTQVRLLWFNQPFRKKELRPGRRVLATGVFKSTVLHWEMVQPQVRYLEEEEQPPESLAPLPVYGLTEGVKQYQLRSLMRRALPGKLELLPEVLPPPLRDRLDVVDIYKALQWVHFPDSMEQAQAALRRFKLQELLVLQLAITMQRKHRESQAIAPVCEPTGKIHSRILNRFEFELTSDQLRSIEEVGRDMARSIPMNRLLQGDVGSGKTVVAQYAMLLCVAHGYQAALMAPTDVLAQQHALTLEASLASSRVRVALLTGGMRTAERNEVQTRMARGEVELVVGTQALLSESVQFKNLGLVIVDEQHKFGVMQRAKLRVDGGQPHYLVLSATPIPRTVAMTEFGDLDVSTIRSKPPGRSPVRSYVAQHQELDSWWNFVRQRLSEGRQAFVVAPRVSASEEVAADDGSTASVETQQAEIASAEGTFRLLTQEIFPQQQIGLLHGRMQADEKQATLQAFSKGELDLLVATTVVEVGINVPNATVMTILDADRLGLAQLHQLRGRVARGSLPGFVCAVASQGCNATEHERLRAFESCDDGFELAELDLKLRGPGDLLGTSQSGLPPLRLANLSEDQDFLELARAVAREMLRDDPGLEDPALGRLRKQTLGRYGAFLELSDVG